MTQTSGRPLRVAMFTDYFPPHVGGGVEKVVDELSRGLVRGGAEVDLFTLRTAGGPKHEVRDGVHVHRSGAIELTKLLRLQTAFSPALLWDAYRRLRANPPDVIHAHTTFFFSSLVAAALAKLLRRPLVTTLHVGGLDAMPLAQRLPVLAYERSLGRAVVSASARVVCVSQAVADYAPHLGAKPQRTVVQLNAVDCDAFHPAEVLRQGPPRLVFVGRLIQNKGPQFLIEALPGVFARHPEATLWMVGDGPLRASLEARCRELGIADRVQFLGTRSDVADLMRDCDVFVRPSLMEGLPLTVLEAMASGLPAVATPVGGTAEVLQDGVTGRLVPPRDVAAIETALDGLLSDADLRRRMGAAARHQVESDFGWSRVVQDTLGLYDSVVTSAPVSVLVHEPAA
ncbi:MAG: glycosyltransferase family 4 protein [Dehalococcoidia bacterium]